MGLRDHFAQQQFDGSTCSNGSWLCENSEMRNCDRITISSKLSFNARKFVGVLKFGRSEETILLCFQFLAFLHNQGQTRLGKASCRSSHVRNASDRYRSGKPLNPTRRATRRHHDHSLDHLVGACQYCLWNRHAHRLSGLEVDHQSLEPKRGIAKSLIRSLRRRWRAAAAGW
jgi:hypothetical protein